MPQFVIEEYFLAYISPLFISHEFYKHLRTVKFALNSNYEKALRTIYDDLSCGFVERFAPSHLFKSMQRKELAVDLVFAVS